MARTPKPGKTIKIQSIERASAILDAIAARESASLSEISRDVGLNKTTAFYIIETLASLGFVARSQTDKSCRLGLKHLELGRSVQRRLNIAVASRTSLLRLCHATKETVSLAIPYLYDALIVDSLEGAHGVRATSYAGTRAPYHATACGKSILAFQDEATRKLLYDVRPLLAVTPNTITDVAALEQQLAEIRARGYSLDLQENELSASCVAAPIFDGFGQIAGAISIAGPTSRMSPSVLGTTAQAIISETRLISASLGARLAE